MKKCMMILFLVCLLSLPASAAITHRYDFTNDANDVVGGLESTLEGNAVVTGGALVLDGTDDWLELDGPGIAINTYTEGISWEFWFVDNGLSGWTRVFDFGDTDGTGGYGWFYTTSGPGNSRLSMATQGFPGYNFEEQVQGPVLTAATTYHVVCTYEPDGGTGTFHAMRIYQDGVEVGANEEVTQLVTAARNNYARLGKALYEVDPEFNGTIDEFRIYDKALNEAEVRFTNVFGPDNAYPIALRTMSPENGATWISTLPALAWTPEPDLTVTSYTLYVGTDPNIADPNIANISGISKLIVPGLTTDGYTIPEEDRLPFDSDIYWRVDTVAGATTYQGVGMSFTTIPETPAFWIHPEANYLWEGETAQFTVQCESISPVAWVKWYKVGSPDVEITTADTRVTINTTTEGDFTTSTLTITDTVAADAGSYYAKALNAKGTSSSTSAKIVFKKLVAYWTFDDTLADSSGNGYDGTCIRLSTGETVAASYTTALVGTKSLSLAGTTFIDLVDGLADDLGSGLTFTFWAYPTNAANWARFLSFNNGENSDNIFFSREGTSTTLHFNVYDDATSTGPVTAAGAIALNTWQMFTVTVDHTGAATLYKNGSQIAAGTVDVPNNDLRINNWIGRSAWSADALYRGRLDDMRIFNYALSPIEVATLYTNVKTTEYVCVPDPENPLAYDFTGDCRVNLDDLAEMVTWWIECMRIPDAACDW